MLEGRDPRTSRWSSLEGKSRLCFLRELSVRNRRFPAVLPARATLQNWERVPEKHFWSSSPELTQSSYCTGSKCSCFSFGMFQLFLISPRPLS
ncbi:hypothetical protein H671_6g15685 [Cricetulus griseus]|uniref:Uncharacterized protein n=1 Tax=Cricetulus griseus TaxID=10029 RepID=A0A061I2A3_CRIGR|nr:hypothetical protein H671_6g15685 [Cricetulus griseus]